MDDGALDNGRGYPNLIGLKGLKGLRSEIHTYTYAHTLQSSDPPQPPLLHGTTPLRIEQRGSLLLASSNVDGAEERR